MTVPTKAQFWDYFILSARVLLAFILLSYGFAKLTGNQFGVSNETMQLPLKDVGLFKVSWYLAAHEPFKSFVGVSQILTAMLMLYNRTVILAAFIAIPIWLNILIWDMTFMGLYTQFTTRLSFYLVLTFLILWHYRDKVIPAIQNLIKNTATKFKYPIWAYLILPVFAAALELIGTIPNFIIYAIKHLFK